MRFVHYHECFFENRRRYLGNLSVQDAADPRLSFLRYLFKRPRNLMGVRGQEEESQLAVEPWCWVGNKYNPVGALADKPPGESCRDRTLAETTRKRKRVSWYDY